MVNIVPINNFVSLPDLFVQLQTIASKKPSVEWICCIYFNESTDTRLLLEDAIYCTHSHEVHFKRHQDVLTLECIILLIFTICYAALFGHLLSQVLLKAIKLA